MSSLLDLGCGSAIWTAAVAEQYPTTNVIGVDITPPVDEFGHDNLAFVTANIEAPWSFAGGKIECYDVIAIRVLVSAIRDWPSLFRQCFRHLKRGGWIEIPDITIGTFSDQFHWRDESSPLMRWYQCYRKGASMYGIDGFANQDRGNDLVSAGFANNSEKFFRCYLDEDAVTETKDKQIATLAKRNMLGLLDAATKAIQDRDHFHVLGMTSTELQQLKEEAREDIIRNSASRRYYWTFSIHTAQKIT